MTKRVRSSELDRYLETIKIPTVVIGKTGQHLLLREPEYRSTGHLHPSEISDSKWCLRASYLLLQGARKKAQNPDLRLQLVFDEGHTIHRKWQTWFAEMGILYGTWEEWGNEDVWGRGRDAHLYREVPVEQPDLNIRGKADGWLILDEDYLLEIKSIGRGTIRVYAPTLLETSLADSFRNINRPFPAHIRQAFLYKFCLDDMWDRGLLEREPPNKVLFLYECKENQQPKEFVVTYDFDLIKGIIDRAAQLQVALERGIEPPCDFPPNCAKCGEIDG